jgi:retron-type reverse transcriptase
MKRVSGLFDEAVSYQNIRLAYLKTLRGKRNSVGARLFASDVDGNLETARQRLLAGRVDWNPYRQFTITDPKLRVISAAPFEDRVLHHAIMNVLEPVFERQFVCHTYACRKNKGTHAAILYSFAQCKKYSRFAKFDVRKYFDSIDHDILKEQLRHIINDRRLMAILDSVIDSYETAQDKGVPIGNLTSQFFANLYLSGMDHFILERLRPAAYVRYMDDFVIWTDNAEDSRRSVDNVTAFTASHLKLTLKQTIIGTSKQGLPFLGFLIKQGGIYLTRKSKERVTRNIKAVKYLLFRAAIDENKAAEKARSIVAAIALARAHSLLMKLWNGCRFGD